LAIGRTKLDEHIKRYRLLNDAIAWLNTFDNATLKQIIDWIQKDQLTNKGIDKNGDVIGTYSYVTELISGGRKQQGDHYTLDDTGDFYRSMYVQVLRESIVINANANKGLDNLFVKFGTGIIGLTDENLGKLKEMARKSYIKTAKKILQIR
jgi:hypothetical protein